MNTVAVICEYNPFHNGHALQCDTLRRVHGAELIVAVMSGNFTQRGDAAICDRYIRAAAAVSSGCADLVLELPYPYCASGAEYFARAGVFIANSLGFCNSLAFGCETANGRVLQETALLLSSAEFSGELSRLRVNTANAATPTTVLRDALLLRMMPEAVQLLRQPNNILAVEYLKAINALGSGMIPLALPRSGAAHDADNPDGALASASFIRQHMIAGGEWKRYVPEASANALDAAVAYNTAPASLSNAERAVLYALRNTDPAMLDTYAECAGGLGRGIYRQSLDSDTLDSLYTSLATKRYTNARVRRAVLSVLCGVTVRDLAVPPAYTLLLAASSCGLDALRETRSTRSIPVYTRPAEVLSAAKLDRAAFLAVKADGLYSLCSPVPRSANSHISSRPFVLGR